MRTFDLTMLGIGAIIGTGIFVLTGKGALTAGNQRRLPRNRISVISVRLPGENRRLRLHVTFSRNNRCL